MSVLQRFVTDPETAARMFPELMGFGNGANVAPPTVTFLVGPINCETCNGTGCDMDFCRECGDEYTDPCERHSEHVNETSDDGCCPDCDGKGYPARIEIVSGCTCESLNCNENPSVEGVVALGKPIPVHPRLEINEHNEIIVAWDSKAWHWPIDTEPTEITDRLSRPVKPGDTVHPIQVVT